MDARKCREHDGFLHLNVADEILLQLRSLSDELWVFDATKLRLLPLRTKPIAVYGRVALCGTSDMGAKHQFWQDWTEILT